MFEELILGFEALPDVQMRCESGEFAGNDRLSTRAATRGHPGVI